MTAVVNVFDESATLMEAGLVASRRLSARYIYDCEMRKRRKKANLEVNERSPAYSLTNKLTQCRFCSLVFT